MNERHPYRTIFLRELRYIFYKDPRRLFMLLCGALVYLLLFALLYAKGPAQPLETVIYDADRSALSREFIRDVDSAYDFRIIGIAPDEDSLREYLRSGHHTVAFYIPEHFGSDVKSGRTSKVLFIADTDNLIVSSTAMNATFDLVAAFSQRVSADILAERVDLPHDLAAIKASPFRVGYRLTGNPTQNYLFYLLLGLGLVALQQTLLIASAASFLYRPQGFLPSERRLNAGYVYLCKLAPYLALSYASYLAMTFGLASAFSIPRHGPTLAFLVLGLAFLAAVLTTSTWLAMYCGSELTFTRWSLIYAVPSFIISGYTWPPIGMPLFARYLSYAFPLTYLAIPYRDLFLLGNAPWLRNSLILFVAAGIFLFLGILRFRRYRAIAPEPEQPARYEKDIEPTNM